MDRKWGKRLTDVKVIPDVSLDVDHRLLIAVFKSNIRQAKAERPITRIKHWKLQNKEKGKEFRNMVQLKLPNGEIGKLAEEWSSFKNSLVETAEEICGRSSGKKREKPQVGETKTPLKQYEQKARHGGNGGKARTHMIQ